MDLKNLLEDQIGVLRYGNESDAIFLSGGVVENERGEDILMDVVTCITSPWKEENVCVVIHQLEESKYVCEYYSVVYDDVNASFYGVGESEDEAKHECKRILEKVLKLKDINPELTVINRVL